MLNTVFTKRESETRVSVFGCKRLLPGGAEVHCWSNDDNISQEAEDAVTTPGTSDVRKVPGRVGHEFNMLIKQMNAISTAPRDHATCPTPCDASACDVLSLEFRLLQTQHTHFLVLLDP